MDNRLNRCVVSAPPSIPDDGSTDGTDSVFENKGGRGLAQHLRQLDAD